NGASDNCIVEKCRFIGNYSTAAIVNDTAACTDLLIDDLTCKVKDGEPGIEVHADCTGIIRNAYVESTGLAVDSMIVAAKMSWFKTYGVTADGTAAVIIGGGEVAAALDAAVPITPTGKSLNDILSKLDGANTYDNTTDSLEAISDKITAISAPSDVTDAVPDTPTSNSLQDILSELDGANTYNNTTDSLEAISNFVRTGATLGAGINLDHLMKTAVVDEQDMSAEIATGSALAHILVKAAGGDVNDFDPTTDSLQAIADAVTGFTTAVSTTPTARSVQDILEKDGTGSFDDATDSLEAIADFLIDADLDKLTSVADGTGNYPVSVVQDSVIAMILSKSANPVASSFDNQTDSLEAIRDNQQTAARAAIDDAELDHLCELDGATQVYPENAVNDSIIAKMLCKGDPATINTYDCQTDSQEAISDFVRTGTTLGAGIQLDHLLKTTTGQTLDQTLVTYTADFSVMAHVMSATALGSTFTASTDSLEAIAAALLAGTGATAALVADDLDHLINAAAGADVYPVPLANDSILAMIMCKGATATPSTYNNTTDSLEAIADAIVVVAADAIYIADGALPAAPTADSLASFIGGGGVALGTNLANSASIVDAIGHTGAAFLDSGLGYWTEKTVVKTDGTADSDSLFTVAGGNILIKSLVGVVTVVIGATAVRLKIVINSTSTNDDRDFSTQVDLVDDAVGTIYTFTNANPAVLTPLSTGSVGGGNPQAPWFCVAGVIETVNADDAESGTIEWYLTYVPLETGVTVVAA
ncbi:hypothetical protein LCGC14_1368970, partial [marine sediment metagenome]